MYSSSFLTFAVFLELLALITGYTPLSVVAGVLLVLCFLVRFPSLNRYARIMMVTALVCCLGLALSGYVTLSVGMDALATAGFYGAFLGALGMMQCLVRRFEVLRRIHDVLLGGPPLLLYPKYAVTTLAIASVLSFGVMHLLAGTLSSSLDQRGFSGESRLRWIRSVLISALRGFALVPLVAPTSVAVAIITREVPEITWSSLLPFGAVAAALLILVGWVLEQKRFRLISEERVRLEGWPPGSGLLLLVVGVVLGLMAALVYGAGFNVSRAVMIAVPVVAVLYMLLTDRQPGQVFRETTENVSGMSNEMSIFAASAALGVALMTLVPPDFVATVADRESSLFLMVVVALLVMPLLSAAGVLPITVLSILGGLLPQIAAVGINIFPIAVALVIGFSLAMMLSPMGPAVTLLARFGQVRQSTVAFGWNGVFVILSLPLLLIFLWILS